MAKPKTLASFDIVFQVPHKATSAPVAVANHFAAVTSSAAVSKEAPQKFINFFAKVVPKNTLGGVGKKSHG